MESEEKPQGVDTTFRRAKVEIEAQPSQEKPAPVTGIVKDPNDVVQHPTPNSLEEWETMQKTKYGAEYLGITEIVKTFPYNKVFNEIDKYIKEEMETRGYDKTPKMWQDILAEIEGEIGTQKLNAIERLERLRNYIRVVKRMNELKKKKEAFILGAVSS